MDEVITSEEVQLEQEATKDIKEDEVRASIITEYGFDETVDADRIDKLVKKDMDSRKKLSKSIQQKIKYREELKAKGTPVVKKDEVKVDNNISMKDYVAITEAKVSSEDLDEVIDYAKHKNISIQDALKSSVVKTILKQKAEERDTANAAATGPSRRTTVKQTGEALIEEASKGKLPESDEDMAKLSEARMNQKKARK